MQDLSKAHRIPQVYLLVLSLYFLIRTAFFAVFKQSGSSILFHELSARDLMEAGAFSAMICLVMFLRLESWFKVLLLAVAAITFNPVLGLASYIISGAWQLVEFSQYYSRSNSIFIFSLQAITNAVLFLLVYATTAFLTFRSGKAA